MRAELLGLLGLLGLAACGRDGVPAVESSAAPATAPAAAPEARAAVATTPVAAGSNFRVELESPDACKAGNACEATLRLTAIGGYKVNKEYPFKFVGDPASGVALDGPGTFAFAGIERGHLTLRFRADAAGIARVSGTFKLSVCTDEQCAIESPKIEFDVPVS